MCRFSLCRNWPGMQVACALLEICYYCVSCYHVQQDKLDPIAHAGCVEYCAEHSSPVQTCRYVLHSCIAPRTHSPRQVPLCYCMSIHRDIQSAFQCSHYSQICSGAQCFVNLDTLCIHMYIRTYAHMVLVYSDLLPYPEALLNRDQT